MSANFTELGVGARVSDETSKIWRKINEIKKARHKARSGRGLDAALIERAREELRQLVDELNGKIVVLEAQKKRIQREIDEAGAESTERLRRDLAQVNFELRDANENIFSAEHLN